MDKEFDRRSKISFLQAENLSPLPAQLALLKLNRPVRIKLERILLLVIETNSYESAYFSEYFISSDFKEFLADYFQFYADETPSSREHANNYICNFVKTGKDSAILDFLQAVCRKITHHLADPLNLIFQDELVPYRVLGDPPTMMPISSNEQADQFINDQTAISNLPSSNIHISRAAEALNKKDYSGSVRESIHSIESTIKQLSGDENADLSKGLKLLERDHSLHGALSKALQSLYGWTSDEKGVRHALINPSDNVTEGMALFMFSACTAFSAWLVREQRLKAVGQ